MIEKKVSAASAVDEIIANAETLQTLLDCMRAEMVLSPIKREMMGSYANFYEGDVHRLENLIHAASKLLNEITDFGDVAYQVLCAAGMDELQRAVESTGGAA